MNDLEYKLQVGTGLELDFVASIISKFSTEIKRVNEQNAMESDSDFRQRLLDRLDDLFRLNPRN
jgi:hypothetical protein